MFKFLSFILFLIFYKKIIHIYAFKLIGEINNIHYLKFNNIIPNDNSDKNLGNNCIISNKNNYVYCDDNKDLFIKDHDYIKDKKLISISPGGFKGFYLLGILTFIKENYNLNDFIFSGASAGSWNGLFMCYNGDVMKFIYNILDYNIKKSKSITELQYFLKYKLLSSYNDDDFDLNKLFIGVTTFKYLKSKINIYSDFENLDDAINCCMASSHIPLITGTLTNRYHNLYSFDGGLSNYPYLNILKPTLHVSPNMWNELSKNNLKNNKFTKKPLNQFSELFSISKNNLLELYDDGYEDAKKNKHLLDKIFVPKDNNIDDNNCI